MRHKVVLTAGLSVCITTQVAGVIPEVSCYDI